MNVDSLLPRRAGSARSLALGLILAFAGCRAEGPRALVLADGSGAEHAAWVDERTAGFQKERGRAVRVLRVGAEDALNLATRGDADVALVPAGVPIDAFERAGHGRASASAAQGALRVLVVEAATHPKVDAEGAAALSGALAK